MSCLWFYLFFRLFGYEQKVCVCGRIIPPESLKGVYDRMFFLPINSLYFCSQFLDQLKRGK